MTVLLKNNAYGYLSSATTDTATSIILTTGTGANFPSVGTNEYFYATISTTGGAYEIVKCTGRSGDALTVVRGQEGTTAGSFPAGSLVDARVTAQSVVDAINDRIASATYGWISSTLTIASGAITAQRNYHLVAGEGGVADDLTNIIAVVNGQMLVLRAASDSVTITVKSTGNIKTSGSDMVLDNQYDTITLIWDTNLSVWLEIARSNNGA